MRARSGSTAGTLAVLAVVIAVAVIGMAISDRPRPVPPFVIVELPAAAVVAEPPADRIENIDTAAGDAMADPPPATPLPEAIADPSAPPAAPIPEPATAVAPLALVAAPPPPVDAVVVSRRSNLRAAPGTEAEVLARLEPGERALRLDDKPVLGYYRVSYGGRIGWIWWLNVRDGPGGNVPG